MKTTFIHTADWQLGKPFGAVRDEEKRSRLQQERVAVIERVGRAVREGGAAFVLVAGDLFDSPTVTRSVVSAACAAIGRLDVPVLVIPGNHDHGGAGSLWEQPFFLGEREELAPNLRVLLAPEPVELAAAVILPCPLLRRHESLDPAAWVASVFREGDDLPARPRIVLAHGSVQGFGSAPEEDEDAGFPNLINLGRLQGLPIDYIALGDWHGTKSVGVNAWYSGTPEPDRFPRGEEPRPGSVLKVTVGRGEPPVVESVVTGGIQWRDASVTLDGEESLAGLEAHLNGICGGRAGLALVRLVLDGVVGIEGRRRLDERLEAWEARLLDLRVDDRVGLAPTEAEIEGLARRTGDPLIARVAQKLLEERAGSPVAMAALRSLYALANLPAARGVR